MYHYYSANYRVIKIVAREDILTYNTVENNFCKAKDFFIYILIQYFFVSQSSTNFRFW